MHLQSQPFVVELGFGHVFPPTLNLASSGGIINPALAVQVELPRQHFPFFQRHVEVESPAHFDFSANKYVEYEDEDFCLMI